MTNPAAILILILAIALRFVVALTLGISDDEAWYWALSKNLQTSYVVHPPLSVWITAGCTKIFGDNIFAVRLPALVFSSWGAFLLLGLCRKMHWGKGAHITSAFCLAAPLLFLGGVLMGPDLPLFAFWISAMTITYDVVKREDNGVTPRKPSLFKWILLGTSLGLALLSKYTGVLAVIACGLSLVFTPVGRKRLRTPGPYVALIICAALFIPVILWNMHNNWSSFNFQFVSRHGDGEVSFKRWWIFWLSQFFLYGPVLLIGWFALFKQNIRPNMLERDLSKIRFLALWALLPGLLFFTQPLVSPFKIHWALFAYLPVAVYAAKLYIDYVDKRLVWTGLYFTLGVTSFGMLCFYVPILPEAVHFFTRKAPTLKHDITNDFYGWSDWAEYIETNLPANERDLPILSSRYQNAAQAAFALQDKGKVLLIPHESFETRDWQGVEVAPEKFLYVVDNRYSDPPESVYPAHLCQPALSFEKTRGGFLAKKIDLFYCARKSL